jgi:hypothetical protein
MAESRGIRCRRRLFARTPRGLSTLRLKQRGRAVVSGLVLLAAFAAGMLSFRLSDRPAHHGREESVDGDARSSNREHMPRFDEAESRATRSAPSGTAEPSPRPRSATEAPTGTFYDERHAEIIRRHRAEPIDPAWSSSTESLVDADLAPIETAADFDLREIECRANTCRAVVRWPRFDIARSNYRYLLATPIRVNCARTILVPEAADDEPVEATLILDCTDWKASGAKPLSLQPLPITRPDDR